MPANLAIVTGLVSGVRRVMTSPDLVSWTTVSSWPGAGATNVNVTGDTYFVSTASPGANDYAWSTDGVTWTLGSSGTSAETVAWTGTRFVSLNATAARAGPTPAPWSAITGPATTVAKKRMLFELGVLVTVGTSGSQPPLAYSADGGVTWSTYTPSPNAGANDIAFGAGRFVAVRNRFGALNDSLLTSTTGTSWSVASTGINNRGWYGIAYGNGIFVAIGQDGSAPVPTANRVMTSPDGVTWTGATPTGGLVIGGNSKITFWNGMFAVVSPSHPTIWTSPDGLAWTGTTFAGADWRGIGAGPAITLPTSRGWFSGQPIGG